MQVADLIARYGGSVPRYTSYPTAPQFQPCVDAGIYANWLRALPPEAPLSLYLHVPFCDRLCLYCGCNTTVVRREAPRRAYAALLERELRLIASCIGRRAEVTHVHWGGGTPTTLPADCLTDIMALIRTLFHMRPNTEIAIEIDPTALPADRLSALAHMGVTRASLGVQDFEPAVQTAIGRTQTYQTTQDCTAGLRSLAINSLNLDLIYGLPLQTEASVARTAALALALRADRIAVFGYAHVPWMKRHQALIAPESLPGPEARYNQSQTIGRVLENDGGYVRIGLDHYALPADALAQTAGFGRLHRNFQGYTTDAAPVLIGVGASAICCLPQGYVQNASAIPAYSAAVGGDRLATARGVALTHEDRLRRGVIERIMCDLRVDLRQLATEHDADATSLLEAAQGLDQFVEDGLVRWDGQRLEVTEAGRPFLRSVAALFDAYVTRDADTPRHAQAV